MLNWNAKIIHVDGSETQLLHVDVDTIILEDDDYVFLKGGRVTQVTPKVNVQNILTQPEADIKVRRPNHDDAACSDGLRDRC